MLSTSLRDRRVVVLCNYFYFVGQFDYFLEVWVGVRKGSLWFSCFFVGEKQTRKNLPSSFFGSTALPGGEKERES